MPATPFVRLDHLVIAVRNLDAAARDYGAVLGRRPSWRGTHPAYGTANVLFGLDNCYVELLALAGHATAHPIAAALTAFLERSAEGLFAVALGSDDLAAARTHLQSSGLEPGPILPGTARDDHGTIRRWQSFTLARSQTRGINVFAIAHEDRAAIPLAVPYGDPDGLVRGVDHVVIFSDDLAGALVLWRDVFAIPERWRHEFPERGTVNVGLRCGGVTLELVAPLVGGTGERGERAWGLAYAVDDVDRAVSRLRTAAVPVGDARVGLAPGTRVCTVKWAERLPTLLIQHDPRPAQV